MRRRLRIPFAFPHGLGHEQPLEQIENRVDQRPVFSALPPYRLNKLIALDRPNRALAI